MKFDDERYRKGRSRGLTGLGGEGAPSLRLRKTDRTGHREVGTEAHGLDCGTL